jgi:hypothetical protein
MKNETTYQIRVTTDESGIIRDVRQSGWLVINPINGHMSLTTRRDRGTKLSSYGIARQVEHLAKDWFQRPTEVVASTVKRV